MDFNNLVTATIVNNLPALINAGKTRFKGFEVATDFRLFHAVFARASSLGGRRQLSLQLRDPAGKRIHDAPGGTTSDRQAKRGPRGGGPRATPPGGSYTSLPGGAAPRVHQAPDSQPPRPTPSACTPP